MGSSNVVTAGLVQNASCLYSRMYAHGRNMLYLSAEEEFRPGFDIRSFRSSPSRNFSASTSFTQAERLFAVPTGSGVVKDMGRVAVL